MEVEAVVYRVWLNLSQGRPIVVVPVVVCLLFMLFEKRCGVGCGAACGARVGGGLRAGGGELLTSGKKWCAFGLAV